MNLDFEKMRMTDSWVGFVNAVAFSPVGSRGGIRFQPLDLLITLVVVVVVVVCLANLASLSLSRIRRHLFPHWNLFLFLLLLFLSLFGRVYKLALVSLTLTSHYLIFTVMLLGS